MKLTKEEKEGLILHITDGIDSCRIKDYEQAEHNLWEIANHLGISDTRIGRELREVLSKETPTPLKEEGNERQPYDNWESKGFVVIDKNRITNKLVFGSLWQHAVTKEIQIREAEL